jgi:hypothetical protein
MMQEFYDKFHPNVKEVEANAEREKWRKNSWVKHPNWASVEVA